MLISINFIVDLNKLYVDLNKLYVDLNKLYIYYPLIRMYFVDAVIMTYLKHTSFNKQKKHPAFKDKSEDGKKVVIVRRRLI